MSEKKDVSRESEKSKGNRDKELSRTKKKGDRHIGPCTLTLVGHVGHSGRYKDNQHYPFSSFCISSSGK